MPRMPPLPKILTIFWLTCSVTSASGERLGPWAMAASGRSKMATMAAGHTSPTRKRAAHRPSLALRVGIERGTSRPSLALRVSVARGERRRIMQISSRTRLLGGDELIALDLQHAKPPVAVAHLNAMGKLAAVDGLVIGKVHLAGIIVPNDAYLGAEQGLILRR